MGTYICMYVHHSYYFPSKSVCCTFLMNEDSRMNWPVSGSFAGGKFHAGIVDLPSSTVEDGRSVSRLQALDEVGYRQGDVAD